MINILKLRSNLYIWWAFQEKVHIQPSWCHKVDIFFHAMVFWGLSNAQSHYVAHEN